MSDTTRIDEQALKMVRSMALALCGSLPRRIGSDDLISAGCEALVSANARYDPTLGVPFLLYARHRVHGAMLDHVRASDISRDGRRIYNAYEKTRRQMAQERGETPARAEVAERMGLTLQRLDEVLLARASNRTQSGTEIEDGDGKVLMIEPRSRHPGPDETAERIEVAELLAKVGQMLRPRERRLLELYYVEDKLLHEIGEMWGLNESRISQIRKAAISKARAILAGRGLGYDDLHAAA